MLTSRRLLLGGGVLQPTLLAQLITSIVLDRGLGAPSYARATTATAIDHEGVLRTAKVGEARFQGARRVENLLPFSQDLDNAAWVKSTGGGGSVPVVTANQALDPDGIGMAADKVVFSAPVSGDESFITSQAATVTVGHQFRGSFYIKAFAAGDVGKTIIYRQAATGTYSTATLTADWQRVSNLETSTLTTASLRIGLRPAIAGSSGTVSAYITWTQLENVSGQSVQTPGEYVSVGARKNNLLLYTEDFSNAAWTLLNGGTGTAPTKTPNFAVAPDGTQTACRLQASIAAGTTTSDYSLLRQGEATTTAKTQSVWLKSNTGSTQLVSIYVATAFPAVSVTTSWQRFEVPKTTGGVPFDIGCFGTSGCSSSIDILVWHPQLEEGTSAGAYFPVGNAYPYNGVFVDGVKYFSTKLDGTPIPDATLAGYLTEGSRTNLLSYSEQFDNAAWTKANATITADATVAPNGTTTADKIAENAGAAEVLQNKAISAGPVSVSVFLKAAERTKAVVYLDDGSGNSLTYSINLSSGVATATKTPAGIWSGVTCSVDALPNGWFRAKVTGTTTATLAGFRAYPDGGTTYNGFGQPTHTAVTGNGIYVWGAQLEAGANASTYIPTTSAAVTRNADVLTYPTPGNFSDTAGTVIAEVMVPTAFNPAYGRVIDFSGSGALALSQFGQANNWDGTNSVMTVATATVGVRSKYGYRWGAPSLSAVRDGGVIATGSYDGSYGIGANFTVGNTAAGNTPLNGTIRNVRIWQRALSDSQLKSMTT